MLLKLVGSNLKKDNLSYSTIIVNKLPVKFLIITSHHHFETLLTEKLFCSIIDKILGTISISAC